MRKLFKIALIILILFVGVVAVQFMLKNNATQEQTDVEEAQATVSPEQLKIETLNAISQIVIAQFIENIMLNMEIDPTEDGQNITISLQAHEFIAEETLLKDSYNLLNEIRHVQGVNDVTLKWYMNVLNKNTEALTLTFDAKTVQNVRQLSYKDLPTVAKSYVKDENVK